MSDSISKSSRGYDAIATCYYPLEYSLFGNSLYQSRIALLDRVPEIGRALVLGDGDGRLLEQLLLGHPDCQVTSVDFSRKMIERQRKRLVHTSCSDRTDFLQHDARTFEPERATYDLLVVAYFLDCFDVSELKQNLPKWLSALRGGGFLYFVDFVEPLSGWRRVQSKFYQLGMHLFFRAVTKLPNRKLIDLNPFLDRQDLSLIVQSDAVHPMMTTRLYQYSPVTSKSSTSVNSAKPID